MKIIYVFNMVLPTLHASDIGETGRILYNAFLLALFVGYGIKQDTRTLDKLIVECAPKMKSTASTSCDSKAFSSICLCQLHLNSTFKS